MSQIERYLEVSRILNKHDPMGLISMGAPHDEYETEAIFICDWVGDSSRRTDIRGAEEYLVNVLYGTFVLYFDAGMTPKPKSWEVIARDLVPCFKWRVEEETKKLLTGE